MNFKRFICLLLSLIMIIVTSSQAFANNDVSCNQTTALIENNSMSIPQDEETNIYDIISTGIASSESYIQEQLTQMHNNGGISYGFEWNIISMLRAGKTILPEILEEYYTSVLDTVKKWDTSIKPTDASRTALALAVMDKDITNVDGINLAELIYNSENLESGANELAYALIALDAANVEIPESATRTKNSMYRKLLDFQAEDGGFGLYNNTTSDVDITAVCMQALAPYKNDEVVKDAIDKALQYLLSNISNEWNYKDNPNSTAQALLALATLKIDVTNPVNGFGGDALNNIITALEKYRNTEGNGYFFETSVNNMATVQIMQAYDAYRKAHMEDLMYWDFATEGQVYDDGLQNEEPKPEETEANPADIYVTIASDGDIVKDKNGGYVAQAEVTVTDINKDGTLTVDEALYATHEAYYDGGAKAGYSTFIGDHGLSLAILWGKGYEGVTASSGYYLNNSSCWSLNDTVKDGDYLTAFNYYDTTYWSDAYSYFDENTVEIKKGETATLTLNYVSGYDPTTYAPIISHLSGAKIVFLGSNNSSQEILTTDEDGKVIIKFTEASSIGNYYVMAYKDDGSIVPTICKINVTEDSNNDSSGSVSKDITVYIRVADPKGDTYLNKTSYTVKKGTSVYKLLQKTGLDVDVTQNAYGVYVKAIESLAEFDEGKESGWMYRVNRKFPTYSASSYILSDEDYVEWLYTRDLGDDLGDNSYRGKSPSISIKPKNDKTEEIEKSPEIEQKPVFNDNTYTDIKSSDWHYESVKYVYENNLMQGTGDGFEPDTKMSRAMLVTVLYRMANHQSQTNNHSFEDVPSGQWYTDAVAWASANGIVNGISTTEFAPDSDVSREQMALILYRYAKTQGYNVNDMADISGFVDTKDISDWALDAIKWANKSKLVNGTSETTLSPKDVATRAQVAAILMRFCENITK